MTKSKFLLSTVSVCVMFGFQDAMAQEPSGLDEIVVTAQRRSENVQDIPVAISAFGAQQLERAGIASIDGVSSKVPSFYFGSFGALRPQLYIRGIGTRSFDPGSESSVGVFSDEVYLGRSSGSFGSIRDVDRIEVLRGPQGTLYGRNTIGGAINVITKAPSDKLEVKAEAGLSSDSGTDVLAAVGGPVIGDQVMFRVAAWATQRDGYATNLTTGTKLQGVDNGGIRGRLAFVPTDRFKIDLTAEYAHDGDKGAFGGFNQGNSLNSNAVFFAAPGRVATNTGSLTNNYLSSDPSLDRDAYSYIAKAEYDAGVATLTSISAVRNLRVQDARDLEGSSLDVLDQTSREKSDQFTQEIRLTSNPGGALSADGKLDWIIGGFYYKDDSKRTDTFHVGIDSVVRAALGTPATDVAASDYGIESYAFFGQATIHLMRQLDVTLGGRYTHDSKSATQSGTTTDSLPIISVPFTTTNKANYKSFDPRIVATWNFTEDLNVYASYSTGFKSGGFQYVPFSKAQADTLFEPEDIKAYEVGLKSEWLDRRVRFNAAAFRYDYKDLQVSRIVLVGAAPISVITNAAASKITGLDLELNAKATDWLELNLGYGYLNAKYKNYIFNATQDFSDTRMVRAPKHTINAGAEIHFPVADGNVLLGADYSYLSKFFHEPGEGNVIYGPGVPLTVEKGYGLLNLRASYERGPLRFTVYGTNVTDENYRRTVNALGSSLVGFAGQPRIVGVKLGFTY